MLTTWNRYSPIDRFFDSVLNDVMGAPIGGLAMSTVAASPAVDIHATEQELYLSIDVPGLKQDDLELNVENGVLTIKGQRKLNASANADERAWDSRRFRSFATSYQLPDYVDTDRLSATLADGVLTVKAPKHERAKPKKVTISLGASGDAAPKQLNETSK